MSGFTAAVCGAFVGLSDAHGEEFDVSVLLHTLTTHCVELFDVAAAGVVLADTDGGLRVAASSGEDIDLLELFELQHDEGPCLDAYRLCEQVVEEDLAQGGSRWPLFATRARAAGYESVHAVPLRLRGQSL